jgi:hypothetical protein
MSIKLPSSGGGASASDVWSYSTRTLTQTFGIIERANGYSSSGAKIYDATRAYNAILQVYGSGSGAIAEIPDDDVAPSKTFTQITPPSSGTFPGNLTDHNDSTGVTWSIAASTTSGLFTLDLGSSMISLIRFYGAVGSPAYNTFLVYGSNDNSTWTQLATLSYSTANTPAETFILASNYRYIKVSGNNTSTSAWNFYIYSFEAYPGSSLPINRSVSFNGRLIVYTQGYYQLLEVVKV